MKDGQRNPKSGRMDTSLGSWGLEGVVRDRYGATSRLG